MLAQAEHDADARVATVSSSRHVLERVSDVLAASAETERNEIVRRVFAERAWLIHARDEDEIVEVIDRFAPEHLSIQTREPMRIVPRVRHARRNLRRWIDPRCSRRRYRGDQSRPTAAGASRFASGLRLADFTRTMSLVEYSDSRMQQDADVLAALADFEVFRLMRRAREFGNDEPHSARRARSGRHVDLDEVADLAKRERPLSRVRVAQVSRSRW